jgi:hypothetical protein
MLKNDTIARVTRIPNCDWPHETPTPALYDAKSRRGPWGYMCQTHFDSESLGRLGLGIGQKLELYTEKELADAEVDEDFEDDPNAYEDFLEQYPHDEHTGLDMPGGYGS